MLLQTYLHKIYFIVAYLPMDCCQYFECFFLQLHKKKLLPCIILHYINNLEVSSDHLLSNYLLSNCSDKISQQESYQQICQRIGAMQLQSKIPNTL